MATTKTKKNGSDIANAIVEASRDAIITFCNDGLIVSFNPAAERIFGHSADEIIGEPIETLIFGERTTDTKFKGESGVIWETLASTAKSHECMGRAKSGEALDLELSVNDTRLGGEKLFVAISRDISARKREDAHTRFLAHFDNLTGLPNRILFEERTGQALNQVKRTDMVLAMMMLDLDRFKEVNDTLGHHVGDQLLCAVAKRLRENVRETDTVTRLGGDEFAILVTNLVDADGAGTVAETIVEALNKPFDLEEDRLVISGSIGISTYPADGTDVESLLRGADRALYRAKAKGRNTYQFYVPEMDALVQANKALERDLRAALECGNLSLEYQPLVTAETGEITGVEALLRWPDHTRGLLNAHDFIPVVERTDLILGLGKWVMQEACNQAKAWQDSGMRSMVLSINLSPAELHHRDLVSEVESILKKTGLDPKILQLEFSEEAFLLAINKNPGALERLRKIGVSITLDNFGSGLSSIEVLKRHPVDRLKIDRSFLDSLNGSEGGEAMLGPLVGLAHGLGAGVIVECVETKKHLTDAKARGATEMQGRFLSEPVNAERVEEMVREGKPLPRKPIHARGRK
ncbi:MAG: EAL domain-containing protein [Rhodospirillales bacterium]|nr:EAL domain-containing protein [Rhodospirillales bacterium]